MFDWHQGSPATLVLESQPPCLDNAETQEPVPPQDYEHTSEMKAMLKNEDNKIALAVAAKLEGKENQEKGYSFVVHCYPVSCVCSFRFTCKSNMAIHDATLYPALQCPCISL